MGNVYRQYSYDPYGNVISVKDGAGVSKNMSTDDFNHAYTYAGYRFDKETGLYFLNARYYAAGIGRFLTKDNLYQDLANHDDYYCRYNSSKPSYSSVSFYSFVNIRCAA